MVVKTRVVEHLLTMLSSGAGATFPSTRPSIILAAREEDADLRRAAYGILVAVYWRPVYARLRVKWHAQPADAEDLTQEFFLRAMTREFFDPYDPARARFRTFLRTCLDRFAANARREESRLKRGGGGTFVPLDFATAERELASAAGGLASVDADAWFDREWVRAVFTDAVAELRRACQGTPRQIRFDVFERYDLKPRGEADRPSYRAVATELDLPLTQVTNHLAWARRELRRLVLERLKFLTATDAEFRAEAEELFGEVES